MNINNYIDWQTARYNLEYIADEIVCALRVCDVAQLAEDPASWSNDDIPIEEFVSLIPLSDDQIKSLSKLFIKHLIRLKELAKSLQLPEDLNER